MGCLTTATLFPRALRIMASFLVVWDFPQPVLTAVTAITGLLDFSVVFPVPIRTKSGPREFTRLALCITSVWERSL